MKFRSVQFVCIVMVMMVVAVWCQRNKVTIPEANTPQVEQVKEVVSSDDASFQLDFDGVVLPAWVALSDIRVEVDSSDSEIFDAWVVYTISPSGIEFATPVAFSLTLPLEEERLIPFVLHSTENGTEVVNELTFEENEETNEVTIKWTVSHFSKIWTTNHGFKVTTVWWWEYPVGWSTPLKITVTPTWSDVGIWNAERKRYYGADIKPWSTYSILDPSFISTSFSKWPLRIDPKSILGKSDLPLTEWAVFYTSFFCEEAGKDTVQTTVHIDYTIEFYRDWWYANTSPTKKSEAAGTTSYRIKNSYTCADDLMVPIVPYLFICPNGWPSRSGAYLTDATTGEPITNAAGEKLDSITGKPIPPCE